MYAGEYGNHRVSGKHKKPSQIDSLKWIDRLYMTGLQLNQSQKTT